MPRCPNVVSEPARAGVEHRHVSEQLAHVLGGRGLVASRLLQCPRPAREVVPARAARGLRVRCDHRHAGLCEVAPVLDALRVALADQEHDRRGIGRAVVRQPSLPVRRQQLALCRERVDVARQRERDHVGLQAVDHGARLLARAAARLSHRDLLARLRFPVLGEGLVVLVVQFARRVVGHVEQRDVGLEGRRDQHCGRERCSREPLEESVLFHFLFSVQNPSATRVRKASSSSRSAPPAAPPSKRVRS